MVGTRLRKSLSTGSRSVPFPNRGASEVSDNITGICTRLTPGANRRDVRSASITVGGTDDFCPSRSVIQSCLGALAHACFPGDEKWRTCREEHHTPKKKEGEEHHTILLSSYHMLYTPLLLFHRCNDRIGFLIVAMKFQEVGSPAAFTVMLSC